VQNVKPSVVSIKAEGSSGSGTGSGFIYREDGYIVTNNHVAAPAINSGKLTVYLEDKTSFVAKLVGRNASYDLAVLKIDATGLKPVIIGDSNAINVGDLTVAFGSPLGLTGTVTSGIVSAINRPVTAGGADDQSFISAIQTDAAINPGNSGGPLVNGQGQVIGVNSAIATLGNGTQSGSIGLGFAIPINQAQRVITEIIESGKSTTPIAGISIDSTYDGVGAKIAEVVADGPAASTDLKVGDIVTKINGEVVENSTELIVAIRRNNPGDTIVLIVKNSAGNEREVSVVLGSREEG
jgi:putative serine protease PepD